MIKVCKSVLLPIALSLIVVGCETSTKRDCPAFFHPDYENWAQESVGETLIFVDQNGVTETFDVFEIERSEPSETENFGSRVSDIPCALTVREVLVGVDLNETILKLFEHDEFSDRELANENFFLKIDFSTGAEEQRRYDFLINLKSRESLVVDEISKGSFYPELQIGEVLYQGVITEEILDERFLVDPQQVRTVAIASGYGLVQYTRVNGSVFSLVQ